MRVTAEVKQKTRGKILRVARKLFSGKGFDETSTRQIASRSGIAAGTLFNYFKSKEELGMTLVAEALEAAKGDFDARKRGQAALDEHLFSFVMAGLRRLEPYRKFVGVVIECGMSPFTTGGKRDLGGRLRGDHLGTVAALIAADKQTPESSFVAMHLYWTLYLGVLAFWSSDESPNQEDTLVILDQSLKLFVQSLDKQSDAVGQQQGGGTCGASQ